MTHRTEQFLKKYGFEGKMSAYADGVGDYFNTIMKGPSAVWNAVTKKIGGFTEGLLPSWFIKGTGSIISKIKEMAQSKIKRLIDDWGFGEGNPAPNIKAAAVIKEPIIPAQVIRIIAQIQRELGGNQKIVQLFAVRDINTRNGNAARGLSHLIQT